MNERVKHKAHIWTRAKHKTETLETPPSKVGDPSLPGTTTTTTTSQTDATKGGGHVSAAQKKALGLDDEKAATGTNAGARTAKLGLEALTPKKKKHFFAGVAAMVLGLTLLSSVPNLAKADEMGPAKSGSPIAVQLQNHAYRQTLPDLGDTVATQPGKLSPAAVERFYEQLERALRLDARGIVLDMHEGRDPFFNASGTRTLSSDQQKELVRAARDLLMELPLSALSPDLVGVARDALTARGMSVAGLENKKLGELGDIGKDLIADIVKDLRNAHPVAFHSLGAAGAVALGAVAGFQGTDALRSLGVRPEVRLRFLDGALQTRVRAEWEQRFTNPKLSAGVYGNFPLGNFQGQAGIALDATGPNFGHLAITGVTLSGSAAGVLENGGLLGISGQTQVNGSGHVTSATVGTSYSREPWTVGAGVTWVDGNATGSRFQGSLSVGYRPSRNVDVFLLGTVDNQGQRFVGVGARLGF